MMKNLKGIFEGEYISATPIPEKSVPLLTQKFSRQYLKPGQTLILKTKVQPEILAGYILKIGLSTHDFSYSSAIRKATQTKERAYNQYQSSLSDTLKQIHPIIG